MTKEDYDIEVAKEYTTLQERIATLEKENAELKEEIGNLKKTYRKQRNKRIDDLQKENAKLRTRLEALEGQTPWKDIKDKSEVIGQLTNAKEIISEYINILKGDTKNWKKTQEVAEQFLSEVEKGKPEVQRRELSFDHQAQTYVGE